MADDLAVVTWARGAQAIFPVVPEFSKNELSAFANAAYWTGPLPDLVLAPYSKVRLWVFQAAFFGAHFDVEGITVTISRETEASLVETDGGLVPLFTPVDLDAQDAILGIVP